MVVGHGAFELCLPSLGILYQNRTLRNTILGRTPKTNRVWGREGRSGHRVRRWGRHVGLQHYALRSVCLRLGLLLRELMLEVCGIGHEAHDRYVEQYA